MEKQNAGGWWRTLRPFFWWVLIVLGLYGIRTHLRLTAATNIKFTASVPGQPAFPETSVQLDAQPFTSGHQVGIGSHQLVFTHPKGRPFATNFFLWYGERDLGTINLERAQGTLMVSAASGVQRLVIRGPEFTITLTNGEAFNSLVPTDRYLLEATYKYWASSETVTVSAGACAVHSFTPRLGTITIAASHPDIGFDLRKGDGTPIESGTLPVTLTGLPEGSGYQLRAQRKADRQDTVVTVKSGMTNTLKVEFVYGVVTIQSDPVGAMVLKDGRELGPTPLTLPEVNCGAFDFSLRLNEYETAAGTVTVTANQTNVFRTHLINQHFTRALAAARRYYANRDYERTTEAAVEALKYEPGDREATRLQRDATLMGHLARAEAWAARGDFTNAISEANVALTLAPDNPRAKVLVADNTNQEQHRLEAVRKQAAELAEQAQQRQAREAAEQQAQQRIRELGDAFNAASQPYENAAQFSNHELVASNMVSVVGPAITNALAGEKPAFQNVRLNWLNPHLFMLEARQHVGLGYRDCLIVGSQVRENEVQIRFKVFEYEHLPDLKVLGGLMSLAANLTITSHDPKVVAANAEKFQIRIKEEIARMTALIQKAAS